MAHPVMFSDADLGLAELRAIALAMPGAEEKVSHGRPTFRAGKIFATFGGSEKLSPGNHRMVPSALIFMPDTAELPGLDEDPRFFLPAYYGPYGWRAIDLDGYDVDWDEIAELVDASYRMIAPKRLVAELDARTS